MDGSWVRNNVNTGNDTNLESYFVFEHNFKCSLSFELAVILLFEQNIRFAANLSHGSSKRIHMTIEHVNSK